MKNTLVILLTIFALGQVKAQEGNRLTVIVKNFSKAEGTVLVGLYNSEDNYMKKNYLSLASKVDNTSEISLVFENIPNGDYTISLYHDENDNGKLDRNFMGIPSEDYAFSNNADGRFGPPDYEKCVFEINKKENIQTINLN